MSEIPEKSFYKVNEVCQFTDTQPYVLRFWESEFPQLAPHKNKVGQRVYTRRDLDLILRIKRLLHDEEYTIAGARARLDEEDGGRSPVAFLPDGEPSLKATGSARLFEPEREPEETAATQAAEPHQLQKKAKTPPPPMVPHAVSALETPFIPEPPVTDVTHLRQEVRAERARADSLQAKLEQTRADLEAAVREHEEAQRAVEQQRDKIAAVQRELDAARASLSELQGKSGEAGRAQEEVERLEETLADTKAALETERETLVHERAAADALRGRLHAVEANVDAARQDGAQARARIEAAEAEALRWRERAQRASSRVMEVAAALREAARSAP